MTAALYKANYIDDPHVGDDVIINCIDGPLYGKVMEIGNLIKVNYFTTEGYYQEVWVNKRALRRANSMNYEIINPNK